MTKGFQPFVYLACPIANHGKCTPEQVKENVRKSVLVQKELMKKGYAVHNPALTVHATELADFSFMTHKQWVDMDLSFVNKCDIVIRIEGESKGADRECEFALTKGIPVFFYNDSILDARAFCEMNF